MSLLDRYILRQILFAFGFFVLIFTGVVWLTQTVRLIDVVVSSGQGGRVFVEFSLLVLPVVFQIVLPLAGIGATLYATNQLYSESELVVMMSAGKSPWQIVRPAAIFGLLILAGMLATTLHFIPKANTRLAERTIAIRSDLAASLLVERQFVHPVPGITLFITEVGRSGEMAGIFLHDARDPDRPVTYSAERAQSLRDEDQARLVMADGLALSRAEEGNQLSKVDFEQFVFDMSDLVQRRGSRTPRPSEYPITDLLNPTREMLERGNYTRGSYIAEGHDKIALPLLAMLFPALAVSTVLTGSFRRGGFGRRIVVAILVAVALGFGIRPKVQEDPAIWPLMYLSTVVGLAYIATLLWRMTRARRPSGDPS